MSGGVSAWSIRNPIPVVVLFLALTLAGLAAYVSLAIKQFPDVTFPMIEVTVTQEGAAAAELETQVTRVIEDAVAGVAGVQTVTSTVTQGRSITSVEFDVGDDPQEAIEDVQTAVDGIRQELPREIEEPIVQRLDFDQAPVLTYAVSSPAMDEAELSWFIDNNLARELMARPGVALVSRVGGVDREINVVLNVARMAALGVTAPQVNEGLRTHLVDTGGGQARVGGLEQPIRVMGSAATVERLRQTEVSVAGRLVRLGDVASIGLGAGEEQEVARLDGRPVIAFQVMKTGPASDVSVEEEVEAALKQLRPRHPNVAIEQIASTADETHASYSATVNALIEGMLLAAIVVFAFLREWRSTAIAAIAMPLSLIPTFLMMWLLDFSLNMLSMLGLTLVIGILVDDAIVEVENIQKRVERGQSPYRAAMEGADAIGLAVLATTMAIVVVFTPVSFIGGMVGQFFQEFGLTVAAAVLFSLAVARFLTPLLAAYFLKPATKPHAPSELPKFYRRSLEWALDHHMLSIAAGGIIFILSLFLATFLPTGFSPATDPGYAYVSAQAPPGATRAEIEDIADRTTRLLLEHPAVEHVFVQTGGGESRLGGAADLRKATFTIVLKAERELTTEEYKESIRPSLRTISDALVVTQAAGGAAPFEVVLSGENPQALNRTVERLLREMRAIDLIADPRPATTPPGPELVIRPRMDEAARLGVTPGAIAAATRVATIGDVDANVAMFTLDEQRLPIRVRIPAEDRMSLASIENLEVPTARGGTVPLAAVADVAFQSGPARIDRYNRERRMAVQADLRPGVTVGQAAEAVNNLPVMRNLPPSVHPTPTGDVRRMEELFGGFAIAMATGIFMIFAVMVLLFKSFFKPVIILSALPLSIGGAFLGLILVGLDLTLPVLIGLLMLMGLAAKNSILLVEFAIEWENQGATMREAVLHACRERARPIIMTTFAMAAGMLPTAVGIGEGAAFRQPMAVAVIGGLISSTILSLVLVPVVYEVVDRFERRTTPVLRKLITPRHPNDDPPTRPEVQTL